MKLDIFHSLQRVTRTIKSGDLTSKKRKSRRVPFFRFLKNIIRQSDDQGDKRYKFTASAKQIQDNIDELLLEFQGELRQETVKELENLRNKHATCLADIPPKFGTNLNEALHKKINSFFKDRRILSLEKALSLLIPFLSAHNTSITGNDPLEKPVNYNQAIPFSLSQIASFGICTPLEQSPSSMNEDCDGLQNKLIEQCNVLHNVCNSLKRDSNWTRPEELLFNSKFKCVPSVCSRDCPSDPKLDQSLAKLELLSTSDRFFSVVDAVIHELCKLKNLVFCSLAESESDVALAKENLFQMAKRELMHMYEHFCETIPTKKTYQRIVKDLKVSSRSHFSQTLLCESISRVIGAVLVIVSCSEDSRIQSIVPKRQLRFEVPIVLFYSPHSKQFFCTRKKIQELPEEILAENKCSCGKGRSAKSKKCVEFRCPCIRQKKSCQNCDCVGCNNPKGRRFQSEVKEKSCRCGENETNERKTCLNTRCNCFKIGVACSSAPACLCKGCDNPKGAHTPCGSSKRKRVESPRRKTQATCAGKLIRLTYTEFLGEKKELQSIWNQAEMCALFLSEVYSPTKNNSDVCTLYNIIARGSNLRIREKSLRQIQSKIKHTSTYAEMYSKSS